MPAQWLGIREGLKANAAITRMRLFERLDSARSRRVLWIVGEEGLGKSTLLASYVARRALSCLWLDLTPDDADPGWFLAHLGARTGNAREPAGDIPAQVRPHIAKLTQALPKDAVIVLDGIEQIPSESHFAGVLREAIEVTPSGIQWCLISGEPVNDDLAFLVDLYQGERLGPEDLRLDDNDLAQLLRKTRSQGGKQLSRSFLHANGVIGSVVAAIALEGSVEAQVWGGIEARTIPKTYREHAEAHLASLPESTRNAFLALSLLQQFSTQVFDSLVVDGETLDTLLRWERRGLFVQRTAVGWRFHACFRALLAELFDQQWLPARRAEVYAVVARFCERHGRLWEAVAVRAAAGEWAAMAALIEREAEAELSSGRGMRLRRWIEALPDPVMERLPIMRYWLGRALATVDDELARLCYLRAREQFERRSDACGLALCQGGILEVLLRREGDATELAQGVIAMDESLAHACGFPSRSVELACLSAYVRAALWSDTAAGRLHDHVRRLHELLGAFEISIDHKLQAAGCLFEYAQTTGHADLARKIAELVHVERLHERGGPEARAQWVLCRGQWLAATTSAGVSLDAAIDDADAALCGHLSFQGRLLRAHLAIDEARLSDAQADLRAMHSLRREKSAADTAGMTLLSARLAHAHGRHDEAVRHAVQFLHHSEHALPRFVSLCWGVHAIGLLLEHAAFDVASRALDRLEKRAQHFFHGKWRHVLALLRADLAMHDGADSVMRTQIESMLQWVPADDGERLIPPSYAHRAAAIMAYALEHGFGGAATAQWLRSATYLTAPAQSAAFWPWRARVRVLGAVQVAQGEEVWKGLEVVPPLLAHLILAGAAGVDERELMSALYVQRPGRRAISALARDVALVRKLLGDDQCVRRTGRRMGLHTGRCWVDLWAFDELADRDVVRAMALYGGKVLPGVEGDEIAVRRTSVHDRYVACVNGSAQQHELQGRHDIALTIYRAGLAVDDACESFFQGVMRCEMALGNPARAREAYDLLTSVLAAQGGAVPSTSTERILLGVQARETGQAANEESAGG